MSLKETGSWTHKETFSTRTFRNLAFHVIKTLLSSRQLPPTDSAQAYNDRFFVQQRKLAISVRKAYNDQKLWEKIGQIYHIVFFSPRAPEQWVRLILLLGAHFLRYCRKFLENWHQDSPDVNNRQERMLSAQADYKILMIITGRARPVHALEWYWFILSHSPARG